MSIKQLGGVFGRNPTFNDVTIEGQLTFDGDIDINSDLKVSGDIETTGNVIIATSGKGITFADSSKAIFGAGDDLEIYHDGLNSYINDVGTGNILIRGANVLLTTGGGTKYLEGGSNVLTLFHTGNERFRTSSAGVDVTGSATMDGLTVNGDAQIVTGDLTVSAGNVIIGTSGKGIDFSATAGTGTSELLDDYEEGTWTPADGSGAGLTFTSPIGRYTKIGNIVWASGFVTYPTTTDGSSLTISGLPFSVANNNASSIGALTYKATADAATLKAQPNTDDVKVFNSTGSPTTNAQQSAKVLYFGVVYQT